MPLSTSPLIEIKILDPPLQHTCVYVIPNSGMASYSSSVLSVLVLDSLQFSYALTSYRTFHSEVDPVFVLDFFPILPKWGLNHLHNLNVRLRVYICRHLPKFLISVQVRYPPFDDVDGSNPVTVTEGHNLICRVPVRAKPQ